MLKEHRTGIGYSYIMKIVKKLLFALSEDLYFYLRDRVQFSKLVLSGNFDRIQRESSMVNSFSEAFEFTNLNIKSYQIESEIRGLIEFLRVANPQSYIEIGTADGGTHYLVRKLCNSIATSVAIDTDIRNKFVIDRITSTDKSHYITGSSGALNTQNQLKRVFPSQGSVDVLFIDGDHSYAGVKGDFERYQAWVRKGGYIIFHDIVEDWGQRYGRKTNKYTGGVPKFFSEIRGSYEHHTFVEDPDQDGFGIGVIVQK